MPQNQLETRKRSKKSSPLSFSISIGLVLAAVVPLMIMLAFIGLQTRPALISQADSAMTSDVQTRVQFIDAYLTERQLDVQTLAQVTSVQQFLSMPVTDDMTYQQAALHAGYALAAGIHRNADYSCWALFDSQGNLRGSFSPSAPKCGSPPTPAQRDDVLKGKSFITPVYYSPTTHKASVILYGPIHAGISNTSPVVGFLQATLNLTTIDTIVQQNTNSIGQNSYALILDNSGIRIAGPTTGPASQHLFTSVAPLSSSIQQQALTEKRFGSNQQIQSFADSGLANFINSKINHSTFQEQPAGQNENYQVVQQTLTAAPWHYFVFSPVNSVTDTANKQVLGIFILACISSLIVAILGIFVSRRITRPILRAVGQLRENSDALSTLATNQQSAASEQIWVVDSSQVGLQSVQYYTEATKVASHRLKEAALEMQEGWHHRQHLNPEQVDRALEHVIKAATYIESATEYQSNSNQKLATALKVATQVTEQLHLGATSASEAATKLEEVVQGLRSVAGHE
jgi:hypothetical protein